MVILHTADLHLKPGRDLGLAVLKWIAGQAASDKADAVIIAGDLFDSDADAAVLRPAVKKILSAAASTFYVIPGNHDQNSFRDDYDYGPNVVQLAQRPFQAVDHKGLTIVGIPYQDRDFSECVRDLPPAVDILIVHGTLYDRDFMRSVVDEEGTRYLPLFPSNLENIARYVGLGHIHTRSFSKVYRQTRVVSPGSAVALDIDCQTPRTYFRLVIDRHQLEATPVVIDPAPYWQTKELFVFPGNEANVLKAVEEHLTRLDVKRIMPRVIIRGFTADPDGPFLEQVESIRTRHGSRFPACQIEPDIKSWDQIAGHPLVGKFIRRTADLEPNLKYKMYELVFPVFSDLTP